MPDARLAIPLHRWWLRFHKYFEISTIHKQSYKGKKLGVTTPSTHSGRVFYRGNITFDGYIPGGPSEASDTYKPFY